MKAFFVSDIHLTSEDDKKGLLFLKFLDSVPSDLTHLFLVGDIFDVWVASHDYFINRYSQIIQKLKLLNERGVEIHYFEGNHDLHLKRFWQMELGFQVHASANVFELGPLKVRVEHGDESNPEDKAYLRLRWFLRASFPKLIMSTAPGWLVSVVGNKWSNKSRNSRPYVNEAVKIRARKYAQEMAKLETFDYMIFGHTHMQDEFKFKNTAQEITYINLGSWLDEPKYLELNSETYRFHRLE